MSKVGDCTEKTIAVLGATGSIGRQTLEVVSSLKGLVRVAAITGHSNTALLAEQAIAFKPQYVVCTDKSRYLDMKAALSGIKTTVLAGDEGACEVAVLDSVDIVVGAMVGAAGLKPNLAAIRAHKDLALANKETLVAGGEFIIKEAAENGAKLLPVDSEHSAIFQCLQGQPPDSLRRILLTASGGPFRTWDYKEMVSATVEETLKHPNWNMGGKITVDSATLMNKGLEVIEARWLFGVDYPQIKVLIHPKSIVHSMVELADGSILAQMGAADMRLPIQYALGYPHRLCGTTNFLDLVSAGPLEFEDPDFERFPSLGLAYGAGRTGGVMPAVLNAANEIAVKYFLERRIGFTEIPAITESVLDQCAVGSCRNLDDILAADLWARNKAEELCADRVG